MRKTGWLLLFQALFVVGLLLAVADAAFTLPKIAQVSAADELTCVLTDTFPARIYCVGKQLTNWTEIVGVPHPKVIHTLAGYGMTYSPQGCAISNVDSMTYCWGTDLQPVVMNVTSQKLSSGYYFHFAGSAPAVCAIGLDSKLYCWGYVDDVGVVSNATLIKFANGSDFLVRDVSVGRMGMESGGGGPDYNGYRCAIGLNNNRVYCWGRLGIATTSLPQDELALDGNVGAREIVCHNYNNACCAIDSNGFVQCWRQFIDPAIKFNKGKVKSLSCAYSACCVILDNAKREMYCWTEQQPEASVPDEDTNLVVSQGVDPVYSNRYDIAMISMGGVVHTTSDYMKTYYVMLQDGDVFAGGEGTLAQGYNDLTNRFRVFNSLPIALPISKNPFELVPSHNITMVSVNFDNTYVVIEDSHFFGFGAVGGIGYSPAYEDSHAFLNPKAGETVKAFVKHTTRSCVTTDKNNVYCWGKTTKPTLLVSNITKFWLPPPTLNSLLSQLDNHHYLTPDLDLYDSNGLQHANMVDFCLGRGFHCRIDVNHDLFCDGGISVGSFNVFISIGLSFYQVNPGGALSCANYDACFIRNTTNEICCFGYNEYNQLGRVGSISSEQCYGAGFNPKTIVLGDFHACFITTANDLFCLGRNHLGQLGNGTTVGTTTSPVQVTSLNGMVKSVHVGNAHTCAHLLDNSLWCWGDNSKLQLGLPNSVSYATLPRKVPLRYFSSDVKATERTSRHKTTNVKVIEKIVPDVKSSVFVRGMEKLFKHKIYLDQELLQSNNTHIYLSTDENLRGYRISKGFDATLSLVMADGVVKTIPANSGLYVKVENRTVDLYITLDATYFPNENISTVPFTIKGWLPSDLYDADNTSTTRATFYFDFNFSVDSFVTFLPSRTAFAYLNLDVDKYYNISSLFIEPTQIAISTPSFDNRLDYQTWFGCAAYPKTSILNFDVGELVNNSITVGQGVANVLNFNINTTNLSPSLIGKPFEVAKEFSACMTIKGTVVGPNPLQRPFSDAAPVVEETQIIYFRMKVLQKCPDGYSSSSGKNENGCELPCLFGMNCTNLVVAKEEISVLEGFWIASGNWSNILECPNPQYCKGGAIASSSSTQDNGRRMLTSSNLTNATDALCITYHAGIFCYSCVEGYVKRGQQKICSLCNESELGADRLRIAGILIGMTILFFIIVFGYVGYVITGLRRKLRGEDANAPFHALGRLEFAFDIGIKLKLLISLYQVLGAMSIEFEPTLPDDFKRLQTLYSVFTFDLVEMFDFGCTMPGQSFYASLLMSTLLPLGMLGFLVFVHVVFDKVIFRTSPAAFHESLKTISATMMLLLMFLVYPSVSSTIMKTFDCQKFDNGLSALRADYSLECNTDMHKQFIVYAVFMLAVYPIGIPVLFGILLIEHESAFLSNPSIEQLDANRSIQHLRFLYKDYKPHFFYFEIVNLISKFVQTSLLVFAAPGSFNQMIFQIFVSLFFGILINSFTPYRDGANNVIAYASQMVIFGVSFMSLLIQLDLEFRAKAPLYKSPFNYVTLNSFLVLMLFLVPVIEFVDIVNSLIGDKIGQFIAWWNTLRRTRLLRQQQERAAKHAAAMGGGAVAPKEEI